MSAYPSIVAMPMAVEPTKALKSAAAQLERDQQVLLSSAEVERSSWKQCCILYYNNEQGRIVIT